MAQQISEERKIVLRSMAKDCDLQKMRVEITLREQNKHLFAAAIEKEDVAIAEYEYMILVRGITEG